MIFLLQVIFSVSPQRAHSIPFLTSHVVFVLYSRVCTCRSMKPYFPTPHLTARHSVTQWVCLGPSLVFALGFALLTTLFLKLLSSFAFTLSFSLPFWFLPASWSTSSSTCGCVPGVQPTFCFSSPPAHFLGSSHPSRLQLQPRPLSWTSIPVFISVWHNSS